MSKRRHYWYGYVKTTIMSPRLLDHGSEEVRNRFLDAIDEADRITKSANDGETRLRAIKLVLGNTRLDYEGAGMVVHYDGRSVQNWVNTYVNLVGKLAGL